MPLEKFLCKRCDKSTENGAFASRKYGYTCGECRLWEMDGAKKIRYRNMRISFRRWFVKNSLLGFVNKSIHYPNYWYYRQNLPIYIRPFASSYFLNSRYNPIYILYWKVIRGK